MLKKRFFIRYFLMVALFILAVFVYGATLLNMQIARVAEYQRIIPTTYTKKFSVPAVRGEIFDRNGIPLVTNKNIRDIVIDGLKMPRTGYVGILIDLVEKINFYNGDIRSDSLPVKAIENEYGQILSYSYNIKTQNDRDRLDRFLTKNTLSVNTSADQLVEFLTAKYKLDEYLPPEERDPKMFRTILGLCYEFDRQNVLLGDNKYKICENISNVLVAVIKENSHNLPGVEVLLTYERVYNIPNSAPHILGRIGEIQTNLDWYRERGYRDDAIVGISGAEKAFEEYLRGIDGELERTYDQDDNLISERYTKEPVPGKNVYLTIDIKLQQVAEYSISKTIGRIHSLSLNYREPNLNGADANAGAAAAIDPNNGQVLALATYPVYDMYDYQNPEKYAELAADEENSPLLNRATQGRYAPGSVFKIATSIAALCNGNITPYTPVYDQGIYTKYRDYQPKCWYYPNSHGTINVTQALQHSCNYFYYVIGELTTIEVLNKYSRHLGLGEYTGIEIPETRGILASPEYAQSIGSVWTNGQVPAAAIGQSYNVFSPLQMATMLGTVLNGGQRYKATLLLCVKEYGSDEIYYAPEPELLDSIEISEANLNAVRQGMRNVIEMGTAAGLFNRLSVRIGGKTGTAQVHVGESSENGTFVAFAPYSAPEISMAAVIEKGAKGTWAGFVSEDVFAYYFGDTTFEQAMDLPIETTEDPIGPTTSAEPIQQPTQPPQSNPPQEAPAEPETATIIETTEAPITPAEETTEIIETTTPITADETTEISAEITEPLIPITPAEPEPIEPIPEETVGNGD